MTDECKIKLLPKIAFYRDDATGKRNYEFLLFIPSSRANYGMIECYARLGQHSEASQDFYRQNTFKASNANIKRCGLDVKSLGSLISEWAFLGRTKGEGATPYDLIERDTHKMQSERWSLR